MERDVEHRTAGEEKEKESGIILHIGPLHEFVIGPIKESMERDMTCSAVCGEADTSSDGPDSGDL